MSIKTKTKETFCAAIMLSLYVVQKYFFKISCIFQDTRV
jgi:hypothetical protein